MPELPEVETVRRGLAPALLGHRLLGAQVRNRQLRWPVPQNLSAKLRERRVEQLLRRGKYLLLRLDRGWLIVHLGMTGNLRLLPAASAPGRHDHVDLLLDDGRILRYSDPRRFGAILACDDPWQHALIAPLGMEPLDDGFDGEALHALCAGRKVAIKELIMNARLLVGVGNIYANEALFEAGIDPRLPAGRLSRPRCHTLANAIRQVLLRAIRAGGSSIRDFFDADGQPGYFQQSYAVYNRAGQPCRACDHLIRQLRQSGRSSYYCPHCQRR
jgi:formamidopyrimidine-DNA glycosylase